MLAEGFEYGYTSGQDVMWCVFRGEGHRALCGWWRSYAPAAQPAKPESVHDRCWELYASLVAVCPVCGGWVVLADDVIGPHAGWVRTRDGVEVSDRPCAGAGMAPEVDG